MPFNILIPSAGMRYMHIKLFKESQGVDRVVTTEINDAAPGIFSADVCYRAPRAGSPQYPDAIMRICQAEKINAIVPLLDLDIAIFSDFREKFEEKGIQILLSPKETVAIAMDKLATADFLLKNRLPAPRTVKASEWTARAEKIEFPVLIKPRFPSKRSAKGYDISVLSDQKELDALLTKLGPAAEDYVFQEYLTGAELTVDFFCGGDGALISAVPGERISALSRAFSKNGGAISQGKVFHDKVIQEMVERLTSRLRFFGPGNFQAYRSPGGQVGITEINPRMTGATVMTNASGRPFFQWSVDLLLGKPILPPKEDYRDVRMTSWMHPVFFEETDIREI